MTTTAIFFRKHPLVALGLAALIATGLTGFAAAQSGGSLRSAPGLGLTPLPGSPNNGHAPTWERQDLGARPPRLHPGVFDGKVLWTHGGLEAWRRAGLQLANAQH